LEGIDGADGGSAMPGGRKDEFPLLSSHSRTVLLHGFLRENGRLLKHREVI